jgi:hypothetical protein
LSPRTPSVAALVVIATLAACVGCGKGGKAAPHHRERAAPQDASCFDSARPRAFFYPAANRTDYGPDDPKQDGCTLLVPDHLFCCPDVKRSTDR